MDRAFRNVEIFEDSMDYIKENERLSKALARSLEKQRIYLEGEKISNRVDAAATSTAPASGPTIIVSSKRSFEAASQYARAGKKVCVLNFASATNPGGGVVRGSSAQEECLCRCSTLYPCLNLKKLWDSFYEPHRAKHNTLYNDDCIYTPDVLVFKSDIDFPERMEEQDWYTVDVLTCAAPNLRHVPGNWINPGADADPANITNDDLSELLLKRIDRIFQIAVENGS